MPACLVACMQGKDVLTKVTTFFQTYFPLFLYYWPSLIEKKKEGGSDDNFNNCLKSSHLPYFPQHGNGMEDIKIGLLYY